MCTLFRVPWHRFLLLVDLILLGLFLFQKSPLNNPRHRHRFEVNNHFLPQLEGAGLRISGRSTDGKLVEVVEVPDHPWFVACQFHPEFTSTPRDGHPLFKGFVEAALARKKES